MGSLRTLGAPFHAVWAAALGGIALACCTGTPPAPPPRLAEVLAVPAAAAPDAATPSATDPTGEWEIRWDRGFAKWQPPIFNGTLTIGHDDAAWTATLHFKESGAKPEFVALETIGDRIDVHFGVPADESGVGRDEMELAGWIRGDHFVGEMRWGKTIPWTPCGGRRTAAATKSRQLNAGNADHSLPKDDAALSGADPAVTRALLDRARDQRSSAIVIVKDGKIARELYRDGYDGSALPAMSASKSLVSLAIGMLIADGKLSLDTKMGQLFPDWKKLGAKSAITVRQLLTHTSGLEPSRADFSKETIREHALNAKLVFPPGTNFQYNNGAVDFLAVVFQQAAGVSLDEYLDARVFHKLDTVATSWMKDSAGTPRAAGELIIRPVDLAKVGQLMLDGGTWNGERIVSTEWIAQSVGAGQKFEEDYGYLWWREGSFAYGVTSPVLDAWRTLGFDAAAKSARPLVGKKFASYDDLAKEVRGAIGVADAARLTAAIMEGDHVPFVARLSDGPVRGFAARGWLGQFLVVLPTSRVVAVRMRAAEAADYEKGDAEENGYETFGDDVAKLF